MMVESITTKELNGWILRIRSPGESPSSGLMLLLHGWTGDENAMWVFAPRLPSSLWLIAPRGPYATSFGGYGWLASLSSPWPQVEDFLPTVEALHALLVPDNIPGVDLTRVYLTGFSQGAALAYAFAFSYPQRVAGLAGMAGFAPEGLEKYATNERLKGTPIFVTHGARDDLVPVERARQSVELFETTGAKVIYCEDDVGHKLSASCFQGLERFYQRLILEDQNASHRQS